MTTSVEDAATAAKAGVGHNQARLDPNFVKSKVRELRDNLVPLERQIDAIKQQMKDLRWTFKSETGMTQADFNSARRLAEMEDEDERNEKMNNFTLAFNALTPSAQLNFLSEEDEDEPDDDEEDDDDGPEEEDLDDDDE